MQPKLGLSGAADGGGAAWPVLMLNTLRASSKTVARREKRLMVFSHVEAYRLF
jgi:hypothetical protein